jgi:23S rRNA (cytosine1962-C5)-methyltransferase
MPGFSYFRSMLKIILKKGREKSVRNHHPWLFSGAIAKIERKPEPGEIVQVCDSHSEPLAAGYYNSHSQIRVRILDWDNEAIISKDWWRKWIDEAIGHRRQLAEDDSTDAYRLIYSESDVLPGLIVDKYADYLAIQVTTAGIERVKHDIIEILADIMKPAGIYERSGADIRALEGLKESSGVVYGQTPPSRLAIKENGHLFEVDITAGQKTGFYLDQRDNRAKVAACAKGFDILDCFSHTGAFSVYALASGAKAVTLVDSSTDCLELAKRNIALNELESSRAEYIAGDAFEILRQFRDDGRRFDLVILDPPKFAKNKSHLKKALAGYKDINMLGMELLNPGGLLATFSCSGLVDYETLKTVLFWAAVDTGKRVRIIEDLYQASCHPRLITFPEGTYLKGALCRVD